MNNKITPDLLYTREEVIELGISADKLKALVRKGNIHRIRCCADKRFSFFLKKEINNLLQQPEFYFEKTEQYYYE